ncbi:hypothetical protein [Ehrlichia japonica]
MTIFLLVASSITSWSRSDPPGWIITLMFTDALSNMPSVKGKNASDAKLI